MRGARGASERAARRRQRSQARPLAGTRSKDAAGHPRRRPSTTRLRGLSPTAAPGSPLARVSNAPMHVGNRVPSLRPRCFLAHYACPDRDRGGLTRPTGGQLSSAGGRKAPTGVSGGVFRPGPRQTTRFGPLGGRGRPPRSRRVTRQALQALQDLQPPRPLDIEIPIDERNRQFIRLHVHRQRPAALDAAEGEFAAREVVGGGGVGDGAVEVVDACASARERMVSRRLANSTR